MIGYATIGVADMDRAKTFYGDLFEGKARVVMDQGRIAFLSSGRGQPMLAMCEPYDGNAPNPGNGTMIAFTCEDKAEVDAMHARALDLGAPDEGAPGQRIPDRFYGAYVRDPDGNKLCFFVFG
ncbi:Glyoxalase-like domain protein [Sulfitobacter sp. THAF37]|uniref:VOC family protein n=1 Tax=Sulfitobacter sp. THAF37 TaxID=2587855 RepID=UPI00126927A0|nr:VOC family protein [Sulfitobacter sp. THAF37]QFT57631.1 Glyoxalase-like domain protein [Sulfitobacter sp. THAF37]